MDVDDASQARNKTVPPTTSKADMLMSIARMRGLTLSHGTTQGTDVPPAYDEAIQRTCSTLEEALETGGSSFNDEKGARSTANSKYISKLAQPGPNEPSSSR